MGEVYRARDARLNRIVALKVLPAHLSDNPKAARTQLIELFAEFPENPLFAIELAN